MTTEREQILALAGGPVESMTVCAACGSQSLDLKPSYCVCADCGSNRFKVENRYTADQLLAARKPLVEEIERLGKYPPDSLTWLFTHCRAIGMACKSDSGKWEHDIALFTQNQQSEIAELRQQLAAANARISELDSQGELLAFIYEHDGMIHDHLNPPVLTQERWKDVQEPWNETKLYIHAPQAVAEDGRKGFSLYLDREEWGHVIDGLILERQRSEQRKEANPDSNSNYIADRCAELIGKINTISAEAMAAATSPEGGAA